jgi:hypothetical protein
MLMLKYLEKKYFEESVRVLKLFINMICSNFQSNKLFHSK